ncbi:MAG: thiamine diphosphokinase [Clostridiales bacterium]|nr:thiamine diphosphokinase [Clostridiales bacterium]
MRALIITGGHIDFDFGKNIAGQEDWDRVISVDSGLHFCLMAGIMPDVILGDFDSAYSSVVEYYRGLCPERMITFSPEKDETDTELAIDWAIKNGFSRISILGATGNRLDHELGNIQLMKKAMDAGVECSLVDSHNLIRMIRGGMRISRDGQFGKYVSVIPFTPEVTGLTLRGFRYEVNDFTLVSGSARGISNEIKDEAAEISFDKGILLVIESRD